MRRNFLLKMLMFFLLFQPLSAFSINLEISVISAGNLVNQVDLAQIEQIASLTLHGEINGTDILVIRKMKNLVYLDMTDTKIVNGGDSYYDEYVSSENTIGSYFFDNPNLATVNLPNTITSIGDHAFDGFTSLASITIPNSVENIGANAFNGCIGLINITIPASVTKIGGLAFSNCENLKNVDFKEASPAISIASNSFNSCPLEKIELGRSLSYYYFDMDNYYTESMRQSPFSRKNSLKSVVIKPSVTFIDDFLFYKCSGIEEIVIPNSVNEIGVDAFYGCVGLTSLTIPFSVTNIGDRAFNGCVELVEINSLNTTPPVIKENTFDEMAYENAILNVPLGCRTIYWLHPYWENFYNIVEKNFPTTGISETISNDTDRGYRIGNYGIIFTKENEDVKIYTIQGGLFYNGKSSIGQTINLAPNAVYIVKVGKQTTKVAF